MVSPSNAAALLNMLRALQVQPADPATAWMGQQQQQQQQTPGTYASIADALAAAADGDIIQLLPGTHVTSQVWHTHLPSTCSLLTDA